MSKSKHTPGPWVAGWGRGLTGPTTPSVGGACCGGKGWETFPVSRGTETIAICPVQTQGFGYRDKIVGSAQANASLIAAAPEMLEALPDLSHVISWLENGCDPAKAAVELRHYQSRIDAAIAKAEGRP